MLPSRGDGVSTPRELVELYAMLGRQVLAQTSTDGALGAVTRVAVSAIPGASYGSITRARGSGFQTLGATHPDATANDLAQYESESGPCVDAAAHDVAVVLVSDLANDVRYPRFGPAAVANGVASMLSTRLVFDNDELRASLNLYSRKVDAFDETAQTIAMVMATHGALAVAGVVAREHAASLERALGNSRTIGMAMGILMSSLLISSDEAFSLLRIVSQNRNRKVSQVAADVVVTGTLDTSEE